MHDELFQWLLRMGDNTLIIGQRLSEWCGHAPALEEDIAMANTALDMIGQAQLWLGLAATVEDQGRSADDLAFLRDVWEFRNVLLVEQPNGDFGHTIMRQFMFDSWHRLILGELQSSSDSRIAEIAEKAVKEATYHLERSTDTVIGLGDGTPESRRRMQTALDRLWPFVGEFFVTDAVDHAMINRGFAPDPAALRITYDANLNRVFEAATLIKPDTTFGHQGGKTGFQHSEHLGHLLSQMQWLQRAYPGASW